MIPGRMALGLAPTALRLAAYRACQPPGTRSPEAMADRVSPGSTVHVAARPARCAVTAAVLAVTESLVRITGVLVVLAVLMLTAVLMFAWAGPGIRRPTSATRGRMHQAITTHADIVHLRTMVLLSFLGDRRRHRLAGHRGHVP
jgi:hypothetical protein